jgi:hypothetical protein
MLSPVGISLPSNFGSLLAIVRIKEHKREHKRSIKA